jgi:hypothetical protein
MQDSINELWKSVAGYEGFYEISNMGNIRSVDRVVMNRGSKKRLKGRMLKPNVNANGYKYVVLCRDGVTADHRIHRVVAEAFIENPLEKRCVNHKNGVKTDNRVENLEWVTSYENNVHALADGLRIPTRGVRHARAKLTEEQVYEIRRRCDAGERKVDIAADYGLKPVSISPIATRRNWKHLPERTSASPVPNPGERPVDLCDGGGSHD